MSGIRNMKNSDIGTFFAPYQIVYRLRMTAGIVKSI